MKLVQCNEHLVSTLGYIGLVRKQQGISSHSIEYAPMHFQLSMD